jgi:hypothetical protein
MNTNITLVTGIWDLGRSNLSDGWSRAFEHYINNFRLLLNNTKDINLVVFIDKSLEELVWSIREKTNTRVYHHSVEEFDSNFFPFREEVEKIRKNEEWLNQAGWLRESTQARLEMYNPLVMSKMFLLHNAKIYNDFNSDYLFWIDGGITNTVHPGYFSSDKVLQKISEKLDNFLFICFPYNTESEIHGFKIEGMRKFSQCDSVKRVARGGFFGGKSELISPANDMYYALLKDTLSQGYMGTEESIFTIMSYLDSKSFRVEMINEDGLISTFFENVKNNKFISLNKSQKIHKNKNIELYINTFNSPKQLKMVIESFERHDTNFLNKTKKFLINNSTNEKFDTEYDEICNQYNFNQIKKGNIGICGSRQLAAEMFYKNKSQYMLFFEDDMLIDFSGVCRFGFPKKTKDLFNNLVSIMDQENYDFIKLSFSEFYGHNGMQWSWHNVPHNKKIEYFGEIKNKPFTLFKNIKSKNGVPYADGEVYYSNWPHIINQEGNKKMFIDTKWANPFEQTWMSHIYSLTKEQKVFPAILLSSPITHNRVDFYESSERKEN